MNETTGYFLQLAARRRSVRGYIARPVEREKVRRCIEAARLAPSACNSQPWTFIVIDDPEVRGHVAEATSGGVLPLNHFTRQAPLLVVVVAKCAKTSARIGALIKNKPFAMMDAAIATEHFCLQAAEEGLGTCILGWFDEKRVRSLLAIRGSARPALILTMGYADVNAVLPLRRKEIEAISAWNAYPDEHPAKTSLPVIGWRSAVGLALWLGITYVAAMIGGAATARSGMFYAELARPAWSPPSWLFGPAWSLLYTLMAIAAWRVWLVSGLRAARVALTLYIVQLFVNALWSWLFFAWRLGEIAFYWILLLGFLVLWLIHVFSRISRTASRLLWPYFAWLVFAAALAFSIWRMNPD